jgi:hypothetical protein
MRSKASSIRLKLAEMLKQLTPYLEIELERDVEGLALC